jgi:hypothetical protein
VTNRRQQLHDAMVAFNAAERTEFMLATATRWLGVDGPTYLVGDVRTKALFEDIHGRHWVDGALYAESLNQDDATTEDIHHSLCVPGVECRDLWVCRESRGLWNALMTPVTVLATELRLTAPALLPGDNWARTWQDLPARSDKQELAWIANGGQPTATYLVDGGL